MVFARLARRERLPFGAAPASSAEPESWPVRAPFSKVNGYFVRTTWVAWSVEACSVHL